MDMATLATMVGGPTGTETRRAQIEGGISPLLPPLQRTFSPSNEQWLGQFSLVGVSKVIVGQLADSSVTFFMFQEDGRLLQDD